MLTATERGLSPAVISSTGKHGGGCAIREVKEETGLDIGEPEFVTCTNDIFPAENKHYITIYMKVSWQSGEPQVTEPDKMVRWEWFNWDNLPTPLFIPMQNFLATGFRP